MVVTTTAYIDTYIKQAEADSASNTQLTLGKHATPLVRADGRLHARGEGRAENLGCWCISWFYKGNGRHGWIWKVEIGQESSAIKRVCTNKAVDLERGRGLEQDICFQVHWLIKLCQTNECDNGGARKGFRQQLIQPTHLLHPLPSSANSWEMRKDGCIWNRKSFNTVQHYKWKVRRRTKQLEMRPFKKRGMGASGRFPGLVGSTSLEDFWFPFKHKCSTPKDGQIGDGMREKEKMERKFHWIFF